MNRFIEIRSRGDTEFQKMHWAGWRRASDWYKQALDIREDEGVKQKLFESLILLALREKRFGIRNGKLVEEAAQLLPSIDSPANRIYLQVTRDEMASPHIWESYEPVARREEHIFKQELAHLYARTGTDGGYYIYLRYLARYDPSQGAALYEKARDEFSHRFPDSNLLLDATSFTKNIETARVEADDFILLMEMYARQRYNQGRYQDAEKIFYKITEINQRHPGAWTGLGNIYFWLELYSQAEVFYDKALRLTGSFPKALFGKAMCRHHMGDYTGSNQILEEMIRRQTVYHGEAYYYKAVNNYLGKNGEEVEVNLLKAKQYIPDSVELNAFTGIYYFHRERLKSAELHLERALKYDADHGDAYFYLGWIAVKRGQNPEIHFSAAARSYATAVARHRTHLAAVGNLQLSNDHRKRIERKRRKRLITELKTSLDRLGKIITAYHEKKRSSPETINEVVKQLTQTLQDQTGSDL